MICQKCGKEVRPNSRYCHFCGIRIIVANPQKGGNILRVGYGLTVWSAFGLVFEVGGAIIDNKLSPDLGFGCFVTLSILVLFSLTNRGYKWAIYPIGITYIVGGLEIIASMVVYNSFDVLSVFAVLMGFLVIAFGVYLMRSKDIRAFIKDRAAGVG